MALLSDTDPDPTRQSTLCCGSAVGAYKHSDPEKKGQKERREMKDRTRRSGFTSLRLNIEHESKRENKKKIGFERSRLGGHDMAESSQLTSHKKQI